MKTYYYSAAIACLFLACNDKSKTTRMDAEKPEPVETGVLVPGSNLHHVIAIGKDATATRDYQLVLTWDDETETRIDLPTNRWLRGFGR